MEFLKTVNRRSVISGVTYAMLNVALAIGVLVVVRATDAPIAALGLVVLSKWRVLAVRPRYWFANIQTNLVDFIVSVGVVALMYAIPAEEPQRFILQAILTLLYIGWLLVLKPKSRRRYVVMQAGTALFVGVTALFVSGYNWPVSLIVLTMWLIGYSTTRHVVSNYNETHVQLMSLLSGLVLAELGWLAYHWTIAYTLPVVTGVQLPQISLLTIAIGFVAYKAYDSHMRHGSIRMNDIILPLLFTSSVVALLLLAFNHVSYGSI